MENLEKQPVALFVVSASVLSFLMLRWVIGQQDVGEGDVEQSEASWHEAYVNGETVVPTPAIEFQYSDIVDPSTYESEGLCEGIALRRHRDISLEDKGAIRAQRDWTKLVGPVPDYKGGLGAKYSFMQVTVPECIPERLEIISYANEFAFLYDGMTCIAWLAGANSPKTKWRTSM